MTFTKYLLATLTVLAFGSAYAEDNNLLTQAEFIKPLQVKDFKSIELVSQPKQEEIYSSNDVSLIYGCRYSGQQYACISYFKPNDNAPISGQVDVGTLSSSERGRITWTCRGSVHEFEKLTLTSVNDWTANQLLAKCK